MLAIDPLIRGVQPWRCFYCPWKPEAQKKGRKNKKKRATPPKRLSVFPFFRGLFSLLLIHCAEGKVTSNRNKPSPQPSKKKRRSATNELPAAAAAATSSPSANSNVKYPRIPPRKQKTHPLSFVGGGFLPPQDLGQSNRSTTQEVPS